MKTCSKCKTGKPVAEFYRNRGTRDGLSSWCKACQKARIRENYKNPPEVYKANSNARNRKRSCGISLEQYQSLYDSQNGLCAICGKPQSELKEALSADHDHVTGKIRGLLCHNCNQFLGYAKDSPIVLASAIKYLGRFT